MKKETGKGKEYYLNGKVAFEGEYINDKRDGKGKQYSEEGEIIFIGELSIICCAISPVLKIHEVKDLSVV